MRPRLLHKLLVVVFALALLVPLLVAPGWVGAEGPTPVEVAASPDSDTSVSPESASERVTVALHFAGDPVFKTYLAQKAASAAKADAALSQKARQTDLAKAQATALTEVRVRVPDAVVMGRYTLLLNAVAVRVKRGAVAALRALPGVTRVEELPRMQRELGNSIPWIGAQRVLTEVGLSGRGTRIGIIDSGIDYTHRNFGGPGTVEAYMAAATDSTVITETYTLVNPTSGVSETVRLFPTDKVDGYDFVGDRWPNTPNEVIEPDPDPIDLAYGSFAGGHGSHVAGIAAGFGVPNQSFAGSIPADSTFGGTTIFHGVAPAAKLYALKVCSSIEDNCETAATLAAYEFAADPNHDGDMSDHLDAVNMSLGSAYNIWSVSEAINNAVRAGVAVAQSAGNSGDAPYIHGQRGELGMATANIYSAGHFINALVADAPASIAGRKFLMTQQSWAPLLEDSGPITGDLVYIGRACPAGTVPGQAGEDPFLADPRGKIALMVRGSCSVSLKAGRAAEAGAIAVVVFDNVAAFTPPAFSFGGGNVTVPTVTIVNAAGTLLQNTPGVRVTLAASGGIEIPGQVASSSSRGPDMVADVIKPDVSAPGSDVVSTAAGQGTEGVAFSGTSMASPHTAGVLALVKQAHPTWEPLDLRAAVMNTANPTVYTITGLDEQNNPTTQPMPISRQGAGVINAYRAVRTTTLAMGPNQTGGISFGFKAVVNTLTDTRTLMVHNKGTTARVYTLSATPFGTLPSGTSITVSPATVTVPAGGSVPVTVSLSLTAAGLPAYGLVNQATANPALLTRSEISGFVHVMEQGGGDNLSVPVYAIARKASDIQASGGGQLPGFGTDDQVQVSLTNASAYQAAAEVFAYLGSDANEPTIDDSLDIQYVGVRTGTATVGGQATPTLQFAVKTYGPRTLALRSQAQVWIDANRDGTPEYVIVNRDVGLAGTGTPNGQNASYVLNLATNQYGPAQFFTQFLANNSSLILTVPAASVGVTTANPSFDFYVTSEAYQGLETGTDRAPEQGVYRYNTAQPRFRHDDADGSVTVAAIGVSNLNVYANARGFLGGDLAGRGYEQGLLILYPENVTPSREADVLTLGFASRFTVQEQTFTAEASRTGYVFNRLGAAQNQLGTGALWTGVDNRSRTPLTYYGLAQFNLGAAGSRIEFDEATLTLTGLDGSLLDPRFDSRWLVDLLGSSVDTNLGRATFNMIANAPVDATLSPHLMDTDLGKDLPNSLSLSKAAKDALSAHVRTSGSVTFRTWAEPQYSQGMHLFAWDGRTGGTAKAPSI
ncbi:MAG: S8 family serine peptidase, partial [Anaerolineae bacterium]|nr:S8 family serine peptidase [Anaerolineae bacterium]